MINYLEKLLDGQKVEWRKLGEVAEYVRGLTYNKSNEIDGLNGYAVLRANNITLLSNTLNFDDVKVVNFNTKVKVSQKLYRGDILISAASGSREHVGKVAYITQDLDYYFGGFMGVVRCFEKINSRYLFHILTSSIFKSYLEEILNSSTINNLNSKAMNDFKLPIPPLSVQKEIVKILDKMTELEAALEAELTLRNKQYHYYRDLLLDYNNPQNPFSGSLKKVEWKTLGEVSDICLGLTYTPTYVDSGVKFISAQNTSSDFLDLSNVKYISEEEYERSTDNAKPKRGDVLFTRVGSNLGHPVIVETDDRLCIFVSLGFLRPKNQHLLFNRYLKYWMTSCFFWEQVKRNVHGSAKVNLNTGWLKNFLIPLPAIDIQIKISETLDKFEVLTQSISEGLPHEIALRRKQYEYYREQLLSFPKP